MPIPDFQSIMKPLLVFLADTKIRSLKELNEYLGDIFNLSEENLHEKLPSGGALIFQNRVAWAKAYLKKAGLVDSPERGFVRITNRGIDILKTNPEKIDVKFLKTISSEVENWGAIQNSSKVNLQEESVETPFERMETSYQEARAALSQDVLSKVKSCTSIFFEKMVVDLLVKMGYGGSISEAGKAIGKSGDEGIDGIIKEDKLGLDVIYIQAKKWEGSVGRPEIQKFVGALAGQGAKKGIFITTGRFTPDAKNYVPRNETKIVLIDGEELSELMIDNNLGISTVSSYEIKSIDSDYFEEF